MERASSPSTVTAPDEPDGVDAPELDLLAEARSLLEPLWSGQDVREVERRAAQLLELARRRDDVHAECAALYVTIAAAAVQGDAERSHAVTSALLRRASEASLAGWQSQARARLARLHLNDEREDLALDEAVTAELLLDEVEDDDPSMSPALNGIASSYLRLGLYEDADRLFGRAREIAGDASPYVTAALAYNRMLTRCSWAVGLLRSGQRELAWERIGDAAGVVSAEDAKASRLRRELLGLRLFVDVLLGELDPSGAAADLAALRQVRGVETDSFALFALAHRAADDGELEVARHHVQDGLDAVHPIEGAAIRAGLRWQRARIAVLADPDHSGLREVWEYARFAAEQVWQLRIRRVEAARDRLRIGRLRRDHERVSQVVDEDPLTGLANRRRLDRLRASLRDEPADGWITVAYLDVDDFKVVNDRYGHELGDKVLVELAGLLRQHTRDVDVVGRMGGDEFVVIARDAPPASAAALAERLLAAVRVHDWHAFEPTLHVRVSVGVASGEGAHDELFVHADEALYAAKRAGRDRAEIVTAGGR